MCKHEPTQSILGGQVIGANCFIRTFWISSWLDKPIKIDIQSLTIDHGQISQENIDVVFIENTCMPKIEKDGLIPFQVALSTLSSLSSNKQVGHQVALALKLEPWSFPRLSSPCLYLRPFVSLNPIKVEVFGHACLLHSIIPKHLLPRAFAHAQKPNWGQLRSFSFNQMMKHQVSSNLTNLGSFQIHIIDKIVWKKLSVKTMPQTAHLFTMTEGVKRGARSHFGQNIVGQKKVGLAEKEDLAKTPNYIIGQQANCPWHRNTNMLNRDF